MAVLVFVVLEQRSRKLNKWGIRVMATGAEFLFGILKMSYTA